MSSGPAGSTDTPSTEARTIMGKSKAQLAKEAAAAKAAKAPDAAARRTDELNQPRPADGPRADAASQRAADEDAIDQKTQDRVAADKVASDTARAANDPRDTSQARKNAAPPPGAERRVPHPKARPRKAVDEMPDRDLGPLIRVRAFAVGFVDNVRRREGDVFDVHTTEFSDQWMEPVDGRTPESITGPQAALKGHHDRTMAERAQLRKGATGAPHDPLGAEAASHRA